MKVQGHCDVDFAGCTRTSSSTTGLLFSYGPECKPGEVGPPQVGLLVARSFLERKVASSTEQSETHAAHDAAEELVWLRHLACMLGDDVDYPSPLFSDNAGVVKQSTKQVNHSSAKHYRVVQFCK